MMYEMPRHRTAPGRRNFETALAWLGSVYPELLDGVDVRLSPPCFWPADAPAGAVARWETSLQAIVIRAQEAPITEFIVTIAREAAHATQWADAGRPLDWRATADDETVAEALGLAAAERYEAADTDTPA